MFVKKCCGFIDIRPGLAILALIEIVSAGLQFIYFKGGHVSHLSLAVVGIDSVVGIVASCLLLYGVIRRRKSPLSFHLISRAIYMATSVIAGILIFASISKTAEVELSERGLDIVFGVYLCAKFVMGFYFWICAYSFCRKINYHNIQ